MVAEPASPTARLLWAGCRLEPNVDELASVLEAGVDMEVAAEQAIIQRVSPMLWRALEGAGAIPVGPPWAERLRRDAARVRAHALLVFPRIADAILRPLVEAGHEPLVMKGAALAARYPAVGMRPMDDIDVLLPIDQHRDAFVVLEAAGWRRLPQGRQPESVLTNPGLPGLPLELHHCLSKWQETANSLTAEDLWNRRIPTTIAGAPAFGLTPEDELLSVATHAAKPFHIFNRLLWIVDLTVIVGAAEAAGRAIDWDVVAARMDATGSRTAVAIALTQAARLELDSPVELRRPQATGVRLAALQPLLSPEWPAITPDAPTRRRLRYALVDNKAYRLRMLVGDTLDGGLLAAPGRVLTYSARAARRWLRLRRSTRLAG